MAAFFPVLAPEISLQRCSLQPRVPPQAMQHPTDHELIITPFILSRLSQGTRSDIVQAFTVTSRWRSPTHRSHPAVDIYWTFTAMLIL